MTGIQVVGQIAWNPLGLTIGPAAPAPSRTQSGANTQKPSYWQSVMARLACWAGQEPENMASIGEESPAQDSTHAPEGPSQTRTWYGPNRQGKQVALNPNGASSELPDATENAMGYLATVLGCLANIWGWGR
jgi:hypothetical protein